MLGILPFTWKAPNKHFCHCCFYSDNEIGSPVNNVLGWEKVVLHYSGFTTFMTNFSQFLSHQDKITIFFFRLSGFLKLFLEMHNPSEFYNYQVKNILFCYFEDRQYDIEISTYESQRTSITIWDD